MAKDPTLCYLCGTAIGAGDLANVDHVPPQRFFGKQLRQSLNLNLNTLPTHAVCNSAYREDEEYFVQALIAYAHDSVAGRAVMSDMRRGLLGGHGRGLYDAVKKGFGTVTAPDGRFLFQYNGRRVNRVIWKIVRGMFYLQNDRVLPERRPFECVLVPPTEAQDVLPAHDWFGILMRTVSLCQHGGVFDMRAICGLEGVYRGHFQAFLFWDRIIALVRFHDPTCQCDECAEVDRSTNQGQ